MHAAYLKNRASQNVLVSMKRYLTTRQRYTKCTVVAHVCALYVDLADAVVLSSMIGLVNCRKARGGPPFVQRPHVMRS